MTDLAVLVVGGGGREHALAWALSRSPRVRQVYVAPGNAGTEWPENPNSTGLQPRAPSQNVPIPAEDIPALLQSALEQQIDLTVIGPEAPLAAGIVDQFRTAGLPIFGPTHDAAQLESSKAFAKAFMQQHDIPTARFAAFRDFEPAHQFVRDFGKPVVVKADGLAAGKGVIVCDSAEQAEAALRRILIDREFGDAGNTVVIEECLTGTELSVLAFCDGHTAQPLPPARDHKRVYDGDQGPNTGGMGAYSDDRTTYDPAFIEQIRQTVFDPVLRGMAQRGTPYVGILYAGLMLTPDDGVKVLEFNCRFGDPETQAVLPRLHPDGDLAAVLLSCVNGSQQMTDWCPGSSATVVLASPGYPGSYPRGLPISGLDQVPQDVMIFHAGTTKLDGRVVTSGGRVLNVTALGSTLDEAVTRAYAGVAPIHFDGMHYRRDIGRKL